MKIIVCGAGEVGSGIAEHLASEGNDVVVVDSSTEQLKRLANIGDVKVVEGKGARPDVIKAAGGEATELLIAITRSDEENLFICQIAKEVFQIPIRIARVRDSRYLEGDWQDSIVGSDKIVNFPIFPEREVARSIAGSLKHPAAFDTVLVAGGETLVMGIIAAEKSQFKAGMDMEKAQRQAGHYGAKILAVLREGSLIDLVQAGSLSPQDGIYFSCPVAKADELVAACGRMESEPYRLILASAGTVSSELANFLEQERIKVLEKDPTIASQFCKQFPKTDVFVGDASSPDLLEEISAGNASSFIALTSRDETNIFSALMARHYGCPHRIILINNPKYAAVVRQLELGTVINPRAITVSRILQYVRRGKILAVHSLVGHVGEIIEFEVLASGVLVRANPSELELPDGVGIVAVRRGGEMLPKPTKLMAGDIITLFATEGSVAEAEPLFAAKAEQ